MMMCQTDGVLVWTAPIIDNSLTLNVLYRKICGVISIRQIQNHHMGLITDLSHSSIPEYRGNKNNYEAFFHLLLS